MRGKAYKINGQSVKKMCKDIHHYYRFTSCIMRDKCSVEEAFEKTKTVRWFFMIDGKSVHSLCKDPNRYARFNHRINLGLTAKDAFEMSSKTLKTKKGNKNVPTND